MPRLHVLKVNSAYWADLYENKKDFEVRLNDRDYRPGDVLRLYEYNGEPDCYQRAIDDERFIHKVVKYVLKDFEGLKEGYVVLGLQTAMENYFGYCDFCKMTTHVTTRMLIHNHPYNTFCYCMKCDRPIPMTHKKNRYCK